MIHAGCISTELLLERRAPELSPAERLRVEQHLSGCERCRREHGFVTTFAAVADEAAERQVSSAAHERILREANVRFARGDSGLAPAPALGQKSWILGTVMACAALALAYFGLTRAPEQALTRSGSSPSLPAAEASRSHLVSGELRDGTAALPQGATLPDDRALQPRGPIVVQLAHARLEVARASSLSWSEVTRVVSLLDPSVHVEVDPSAHRSFRVKTAQFLVEVLGTAFRIDQNTVTVERGRVQVLSRDATERLADLGPGQAFTYRDPAGEPQVAASSSLDPQRPVSGPGARAEAKDALPAAALLARARRHLSGGDTKRARSDLAAALLVTTNPAEQALAHMLTADCALVEGNARQAVAKYLEVNQRFRSLPVAETALFSAARVESSSGNRAAARELLRSYLERYSTGQFRKDAEDRLRVLDAP